MTSGEEGSTDNKVIELSEFHLRIWSHWLQINGCVEAMNGERRFQARLTQDADANTLYDPLDII